MWWNLPLSGKPLKRRTLMGGALGGLGALAGLGGLGRALAPTHARADGEERNFLFVFCRGGWDTSRLFAPHDHIPGAEVEADATVSSIGDLRFVDSPSRPTVRTWLEQYADQTCFINGIEVASVAHERCRKMLLAGATGDDWPAMIAAGSTRSLTLPHLVLAGPSYTGVYADQVVRVGDDGQLAHLLTEEALEASTVRVTALPGEVEALADAAVRADTMSRAARGGVDADFASRYSRALDSLETLRGVEGLSLQAQEGICARELSSDLSSALNCFSLGLSRCAMIQYNGWCDLSWDSHMDLSLQSRNFEELFVFLDVVMRELETQAMSERVTVVVLSEMGRHPMVNTSGGKDHWTFTSAMLIGSGVRGGQVIGAIDDYAMGQPVDLGSGAVSSSGTPLLPGHLGATLLSLADVDPLSFGVEEAVIEATLQTLR